jgi:hypothetical protein
MGGTSQEHARNRGPIVPRHPDGESAVVLLREPRHRRAAAVLEGRSSTTATTRTPGRRVWASSSSSSPVGAETSATHNVLVIDGTDGRAGTGARKQSKSELQYISYNRCFVAVSRLVLATVSVVPGSVVGRW